MSSTETTVHEYGQKEGAFSQIRDLPFEDYSFSFDVISTIPRVLWDAAPFL